MRPGGEVLYSFPCANHGVHTDNVKCNRYGIMFEKNENYRHECYLIAMPVNGPVNDGGGK
jgi:hypothetical protein